MERIMNICCRTISCPSPILTNNSLNIMINQFSVLLKSSIQQPNKSIPTINHIPMKINSLDDIDKCIQTITRDVAVINTDSSGGTQYNDYKEILEKIKDNLHKELNIINKDMNIEISDIEYGGTFIIKEINDLLLTIEAHNTGKYDVNIQTNLRNKFKNSIDEMTKYCDKYIKEEIIGTSPQEKKIKCTEDTISEIMNIHKSLKILWDQITNSQKNVVERPQALMERFLRMRRGGFNTDRTLLLVLLINYLQKERYA